MVTATIATASVDITANLKPFTTGLKQKLQAAVDKAAKNLKATVQVSVEVTSASLAKAREQIKALDTTVNVS